MLVLIPGLASACGAGYPPCAKSQASGCYPGSWAPMGPEWDGLLHKMGIASWVQPSGEGLVQTVRVHWGPRSDEAPTRTLAGDPTAEG